MGLKSEGESFCRGVHDPPDIRRLKRGSTSPDKICETHTAKVEELKHLRSDMDKFKGPLATCNFPEDKTLEKMSRCPSSSKLRTKPGGFEPSLRSGPLDHLMGGK